MSGRAEEVDVRARVHGVGALADHLRGEVARRARHRGALRPRAAVGPGAQRDAPVAQVHLAVLADHHVLGLDVPVQHAVAVREVRGVADLHQHLEVGHEAVVGERLEARPVRVRGVAHEVVPGHPDDPLHHQHRQPVGADAQRVHRDDVRVLERAHQHRLAHQRAGRDEPAVGPHGLHRDVALERLLPRAVDGPHAALAEHAEQHEVGVVERGVDRRGAHREGREPPAGRRRRRGLRRGRRRGERGDEPPRRAVGVERRVRETLRAQ